MKGAIRYLLLALFLGMVVLAFFGPLWSTLRQRRSRRFYLVGGRTPVARDPVMILNALIGSYLIVALFRAFAAAS